MTFDMVSETLDKSVLKGQGPSVLGSRAWVCLTRCAEGNVCFPSSPSSFTPPPG